MASAFKNLSETSPALLKWGTFALLALAAIGPLAFGIGGLVSAYGALSSILGPVLVGMRAMKAASGAGAVAGLFGMGKGARGLSLSLRGLPGRLRSMVAGLVMLSSVTSLKDILFALGRGLLAIGKAPFGAIAGGIRAVWAAAALLIGTISWPVVLGAVALALVIGHWKELTAWVSGFWDELGTGIADSKIGWFFKQLAGWIDMALKPLKMLWSYMKRLFGFGGKNTGWVAGEAELSGRSTARKILDFVGLSSAKRQEASSGMPVKISSAIAHGAATTSGGGSTDVKPGLKVHAPATIHLTVGNSADAKDILDTINKAMDSRDEKLKSSLQGAFND